MIEEKNGNKEQIQNSNADSGNSPSGSHILPGSVETPRIEARPAPDQPARQVATEPANNQQQTTEQVSEPRNPMTTFERYIVIFTILGIGIAAITGVIFYVQIGVMVKQTEILANQAESDAAGGSLSAVQIQKQLSIAQQQAQAAQESAKAIQTQTQTSERAWITVDVLNVDAAGRPGVDISAGKPFIERTLFHDTGHTPALDTRAIIKKDIVTAKDANGKFAPPSFTYSSAQFVPSGILTPGSYSNQDYPAAFDKETFEAIEKTQRLYIHGEIRYKDVFEASHWIKFCYFLVPGGLYATCRFHNDIDRNRQQKQEGKAN